MTTIFLEMGDDLILKKILRQCRSRLADGGGAIMVTHNFLSTPPSSCGTKEPTASQSQEGSVNDAISRTLSHKQKLV